MTRQIIYAKNAVNQLNKLPRQARKRIVDKLYFYSNQNNPLSFACKLTHSLYGEYRFRVGDYRVIFDIDKTGKIAILYILTIKHRKDIYKDL